jgi:hypothetical protein
MEHSDSLEYFPLKSQHEIDAISSLREHFDEDPNFRELFDEELQKAEEWQKKDSRYRKKLYAKLQNVYYLYLLAHADARREQLVERKCDELKISRTKASCLSILLVKLMLRPPEKTAYQYALALRYAALTQIPQNDLAEELEKRGHGIAEMARRFSQEEPKKQRAPDLDEQSMSNRVGKGDAAEADAFEDDHGNGYTEDDPDGDADDDQDGDIEDGSDGDTQDGSGDDASENEEDRAPADWPEIRFSRKALRRWLSAEIGSKFLLEKVADNQGKVLRKMRQQ